MALTVVLCGYLLTWHPGTLFAQRRLARAYSIPLSNSEGVMSNAPATVWSIRKQISLMPLLQVRDVVLVHPRFFRKVDLPPATLNTQLPNPFPKSNTDVACHSLIVELRDEGHPYYRVVHGSTLTQFGIYRTRKAKAHGS